MRTFLDRMRDLKKQEILKRSAEEPLEALREKALDGQCPSNFAEAVKDKSNGLLEIIAEVNLAILKLNMPINLHMHKIYYHYQIAGGESVHIEYICHMVL